MILRKRGRLAGSYTFDKFACVEEPPTEELQVQGLHERMPWLWSPGSPIWQNRDFLGANENPASDPGE